MALNNNSNNNESPVQIVNTEFKIKLDRFDEKETEYAIIHFFSSRLMVGEIDGKLPLGKKSTVALPIASRIGTDKDWICMHVYVERKYDPNRDRVSDNRTMDLIRSTMPFVVRIATATATLHQLTIGEAVNLVDVDGDIVGSVTGKTVGREVGGYNVTIGNRKQDKIQLPTTPLQRYAFNDSPLSALAAVIAAKQAEIHKLWPDTNITPKLKRVTFNTIKQPIGKVPICALLAARTNMTGEGKVTAEYMVHAQRNAKFILGLENDIVSSDTQRAEILSEIHTMLTRAALYTPDLKKESKRDDSNVPTDDWNMSLSDSPLPQYMAFDCEEAMFHLVQHSQLLRSCEELKGTMIHETEKRYVTFGVIMSLYLPASDRWTYHAAALKLDRRYVWKMLGLDGSGNSPETKQDKAKTSSKQPEKKKTTDKGQSSTNDSCHYLPAVMLEGTAYIGGCPSYTYTKEEQACFAKSKCLFSSGIETVAKLTPAVLREKGVYGHVQTLLSPELLWSHGLCQIELGSNGKLGVPLETLLDYSPASPSPKTIEFKPIYMPKKDVGVFQTQIRNLRAYYPAPNFPRAPTQEELPDGATFPVEARKKNRQVECFVRTVDFDGREQEVLEELGEITKTPLSAFHMIVKSGLSVVFVYGQEDGEGSSGSNNKKNKKKMKWR